MSSTERATGPGDPGSQAAAGPFPADPQLRLDPGGHTATIVRTAVDAGGRWVVSGAEDKTVRVWRVADGGLETTLRVPLGPGDLGKVYAVALSPDGGTVAVGGWTGYRDQGGHSIYLFDRATGALRWRLGGLPNVVNHLAFDPSGTRLAALLGSGGLRVYAPDAEGRWAEQARDPDYGDRAYWAEFAPDGRLLTSCYDGRVRLYAAPGPGAAAGGPWWRRLWKAGADDGRLKPRCSTRPPGGRRPFAVTFSPDGDRVAVGYDDSTAVDLLHGRTLAHLGAAATAGVDNGDLSKVAWSADGGTLYAGGRYAQGGSCPVLRWSGGGLGASLGPLKAATNAVMTLHPLADGTLLLGAADGLWRLDPAAPGATDPAVRWSQPLAAADLRGQLHRNGIRLSPAGDRLAFGLGYGGKRPALFDLGTLTLTLDPDPAALADLALPDEGPGLAPDGTPWSVTDWVNNTAPRLDGRPLALKPYEIARTLALNPARPDPAPASVLGTEWWLRAFDHTGRERWQQPVPGTVWALNCTADGRCAVAGYGDGTLRWHRLDTGAEVLALYPHPDGRRWVLWTPLGHYAAAPGGEDLIGWHLNRGPDAAPDFYPASRLRARFARPEVVALALATGDPAEALRRADAARGSRPDAPEPEAPTPAAGPPEAQRPDTKGVPSAPLTAAAIADLLPPVVRIISPQPGVRVEVTRLTLFYQARSETGPVLRVQARVDGAEARVLEDATPAADPDGRERVGQLTIALPPQDSVVTLIAWNPAGASEAAVLAVGWAGALTFYKPRLYALAIGVAAYRPEAAPALRFAAQDAGAVAAELGLQEGGLYQSVTVRTLRDTEASRRAILEGLHWLEREVGQRDVAVIFLSGHGLRDSWGAYYFLCEDGDPTEPHHSAVKGTDLIEYLRRMAGKRVLLLDTCYSGALVAGKAVDTLPDLDRFANELADAENGVVVFTSSTGRQLSVEDAESGHGAFTRALLEAIREGRADFRGLGFVTLAELEAWLADRVKELTRGRQHPMVAKPIAVEDYRVFRVRSGNGT